MSGFVFGQRSEKCLKGVHPDLVRVARRALAITPADFGVHCGLRSIEEQKVLVRTGRSRTMNSRHLTGHAIDCHPWIDGDIPWHDWHRWSDLWWVMREAAIIEDVAIEWGGNWPRFRDGPHFQLPRDRYPG